MVDVGGDDRPSPRDLAAHELRCDEGWHRSAKAFAVGERRLRALELSFTAKILALGDVDHLLGDDAGAGEFELGHLVAIEAAQRLVMRRERLCGLVGGDVAVVDRLDNTALIFLDAAAFLYPGEAIAR